MNASGIQPDSRINQDGSIVNSSIVDNVAGGIKLPPTGLQVRILNTIVLRNASYGCSIPTEKLAAATASLQFPGNDCADVTVDDAQLEANYKPVLGGPANTAGDVSTCISAPLVAAFDLASVPRGNRGVCAIGAYEPDPRVDPVSSWSGEDNRWVRILVFWLLLLFLLLGFFLAFVWMRHHRRRRHKAAHP